MQHFYFWTWTQNPHQIQEPRRRVRCRADVWKLESLSRLVASRRSEEFPPGINGKFLSKLQMIIWREDGCVPGAAHLDLTHFEEFMSDNNDITALLWSSLCPIMSATRSLSLIVPLGRCTCLHEPVPKTDNECSISLCNLLCVQETNNGIHNSYDFYDSGILEAVLQWLTSCSMQIAIKQHFIRSGDSPDATFLQVNEVWWYREALNLNLFRVGLLYRKLYKSSAWPARSEYLDLFGDVGVY
jgi:hypothetical protein